MNLQLKEPSEHGYKLFAVPDERLNGNALSDFKTVNNRYEIIDAIHIAKGERLPSVLPLLAYGTYIDIDDVWVNYPKSNFLIFLICKKL